MDSSLKKRVELEIAKSVTAAPNPLRYDAAIPTGAVEYAGHTLLTSLKILDPNPDSAPLVGLWSLTQMPHRGELFIPTYSKAEPGFYFGLVDTPADELAMSDRLVRFKMRAAGEHKIGIRAAATTGRVGYLYPTGSRHALIVLQFLRESGRASMPMYLGPSLIVRGYSAQACSVNSRWGEFSEMEYHVPAIGGGTGLREIDGIIPELWAFRGSKKDIEKIARVLLSSEV